MCRKISINEVKCQSIVFIICLETLTAGYQSCFHQEETEEKWDFQLGGTHRQTSYWCLRSMKWIMSHDSNTKNVVEIGYQSATDVWML